jgi:hypothetical protein
MRGERRSVRVMRMMLRATAIAGATAPASLTAQPNAARPASAHTARHPTSATETCATQSGAHFPHAFANEDNLIAGPLVMIGASTFTDAATVKRFRGNKFPLLVAAGHTVTIELTRATRRFAWLSYGPNGRGRHSTTTFRSCDPGHANSDSDGRPVTFWAGFVRASRPGCVRMHVRVDRERTPRRRQIELGARC